jgi:DNA-binding winged helix-turn-helix (wHTH) protein/tetratricopeptide (TPR) repeat protein
MTTSSRSEALRRYRIGDAVLDVGDASLLGAGLPVTLPPKLLTLLLYLARAAPRLVTKDELLVNVWPERVVSEAALTQRIKELRRLLGDDARRPLFIQTVARRGYRFVAPVVTLDSEAARQPAPGPSPKTALIFADGPQPRASAAAIALHEMLERRLSADAGWSVAAPNRVRRVLRLMRSTDDAPRDESEAIAVAQRDGAIDAVVSARVHALDSSYLIEARVIDPATGETRAHFGLQVRSETELVPALSTIAGDLCQKLSTLEGAQASPPCPAVTTASLEALEEYARALECADRFEWRKARDLLLGAVDLDPALSVAWAWLALAHLWLEDPGEAVAAAERAAAVVHGVSEAERHFVIATHAGLAGRLAEAIDQLELLLALTPIDFWAAYRLAHCYLAAGRVDDSLRMRERCARIRPGHFFNFSEAGFTRLFAAGDLAGAALDYAEVLRLDPRHPFAIPYLIPSFHAWLEGDMERAATVLDGVLDTHLESFLPLGRTSALVHDSRFRLFCGDVTTALADLHRALAGVAPGSSLAGWVEVELALVLCDLGLDADRDAVLARVESGGTPLNRAHAVLSRALEAARSSQLELATALAAQLRAMAFEDTREFGYPTTRFIDRVRRAFPLLVEAEVALAQGDPARALEGFARAVDELPLHLDAPVPLSTTSPRSHLAAREGVARALAALGRRAQAIAAETWLIEHPLELLITSPGGVGCRFGAHARRALLRASGGDTAGARADAAFVLSRWCSLRPEPAAVSLARQAAP